jgi:hypothetical protein
LKEYEDDHEKNIDSFGLDVTMWRSFGIGLEELNELEQMVSNSNKSEENGSEANRQTSMTLDKKFDFK